jgi:hypothetical protein
MTRKSRRKKKKHKNLQTQTQLSTVSQQAIPATPAESKSIQILPILGLAIGLLSLTGLVGLKPRLSASASPPSNPDDILNSRFTVSNDEYVDIMEVPTICYVSEAKGVNGGTIRRSSVDNNTPTATLQPAEAITVPCTQPMIHIPARNADLAIIAYCRWLFTFIHSRRFF